MAELAKIQRVPSVYSQAEDRSRLTGEVSPDDTRCFWLTQRLLRRLLPHLLDWLGEIAKAEGGEGQQDFGQAEVMQDFAQQAAKARLEPQAAVPVPAMPAADAPIETGAGLQQVRDDSWLVHEVDVTKATYGVLTLTFKRGDKGQAVGGVQLGMAPVELRQWLIILHSQWQEAQWPQDLWPEWIDSSPKQGETAPTGLH